MIEIVISDEQGELGKIRIEKVEIHSDTTADYSIQFAVNRIGAVGLHRRSIRHFPRLQYNVLALVRQALETLDPKELRLEPDASSSDMARRQRRALPRFRP